MTRMLWNFKFVAVAAALAAGVAFAAQPAQAGGRVSIGLGFGGGYCAPVYRPAYCPPTVSYYSPAPVYYAPVPTYYAPSAPVYYSTPAYCPAPTYYYSAPRYYTPLSFNIGFGFGGRRHW